MGKKVTVLITSLVMIFNLIASAFISVGNIYAETKSDFINTMEVNGEKVEDLSEIVELREGDKVLLELLHSSDYDGNISINLPKLFKNVDLEYNNDHFNDISIEDDIQECEEALRGVVAQ